MIVQQRDVHGGIAAVTESYYGSRLEEDYDLRYIESYCDGSKFRKIRKAIGCYARVLAVMLSGQRPELMHIHCAFGPSFYRELPILHLCRWFGVPVVNHIHGSAFREFYEDASPRKQALIRRMYSGCAATVVLSPLWAEKLSTVIPREKIHVIQNYCRLLPQEQLSLVEKNRQGRKQVLFLGVLTEGKGVYEMPAVFEAVLKQIPEAGFVLAGSGDMEDIRPRFSADVLEHVSFPGWITGETKDRLLRESNVFFLPSHMEGMPMSVMDAMGYGLPIVSTDVGGIPMLVTDGDNGKLCAPKDTEAYAKAIVNYLQHPELATAAGQRSYEIASETFSLSSHLDKIEQVYEHVWKKEAINS